MELDILNQESEQVGKKKLPSVFDEPIRKDLIQRAVEVVQANARQRYGADPEAGTRYSSKLRKRRRKYRGSYGHGISRVQRKIMSRNGRRLNWVGAFIPGTRGGRKAFPPEADRIWSKEINKKERRKAIRSALAATVNRSTVEEHGHKVPEKYPFLIDDTFEALANTKTVKAALIKLKLGKELERSAVKKIRPGKGTMRGRPYKKKVGPLLVVSKSCKLSQTAKNIAGLDVVEVNKLNAQLLAPGTVPGRLTLFTKSAIEKMEKDKLFA